ncbi:MAG: TonB-dependent receptor [Caulobacterales bacterium]
MRGVARIFAAGLTALALVGGYGAAYAQEVGEVIVVAQKRSENLQDVPISVTAVSGEQLSSLTSSGADILALASRVPGLNVESSNGRAAPRFYIRGLGNTDFDLAASQPVSVIMDDVVMENVALKSFPLFDIQQVEVLRGPQGTLYGRNTPAGIVNIRSRRPTQEFESNGTISYASYNTVTFEGGVGGALIKDVLAMRVAALMQHRDDWVDNGFTGQEDAVGGFDEYALRAQLLFTPNADFSALFNVHGRQLDGTSTLFRANIFNPGSNELNGNFDRDTVYYNQGQNNPQGYDEIGGALTLTYDFGPATLTSITGYETTNGRSLGDIDGGNPGGPGVIPFQSETQDAIDDLDQLTQEIRIASPDAGPLTWQAGLYYFDSDLQVTTYGPSGFPAPATVAHSNTSWAVFGQIGYDITDQWNVTGGLRYTEDDKDFHVVSAPASFAPVSVSDEKVSWDISTNYRVSPDLNLYARVAHGFRAPSIQGRDVVFGAPPSVAQSEKILSIEAGVKADVLAGRGRLNAGIFAYRIEDQKFTAIGGAANLTQLVNADQGKAYGFEIEGEWQATENLFLRGSAAYTHTEIDDPNLRVSPCGTGQCTVTDPLAGGFALVDGNPFPQAPEYTVDVSARYQRPVGRGTAFAETDWTVRGPMNILLYQTAEFETDTQFEGGIRLGYEWDKHEIAFFVRNITDEENVIGAIDFNNLTGFVNEPRIIGISFSSTLN